MECVHLDFTLSNYFHFFFLFRPPNYLHKLQPSTWNHEEIGKFTWKFDSMKSDNSNHALEFVQIKCNLIMIFNLVNKIEPIWYEFGSKTINEEKWTLSKIRDISKNVLILNRSFHLCPKDPFFQNRPVFANWIIEP